MTDKFIVIAIPSSSGTIRIEMMGHLLDFKAMLAQQGIQCGLIHLDGTSIVERARDILTHQFLRIEPATHMFCLDDDVVISARDMMMLLEADKDFVFAPITSLDGKIHLNPVDPRIVEGDLLKIKHGAVSCAIIRREVFEKIAPGRLMYDAPQAREKITRFYEVPVIEGELWGEDYHFSDLVREAGFDIWAHTRTFTQHFKPVGLVASLVTMKEV